jgi:type I restriction enzyme S subunit
LSLALSYVCALLLRFDIQRQYVCFLLNCRATVEKACELVRGEIRGRISIGRLKELQIPLSPLDLQCQFAAIVESVEKQKNTPAGPSTELDAIFASLQQRSFRGIL